MALSKASTSTSYLEEMLTCAVCIEQLREPQTLMQCFHNYCKPCIQQLMASQNNPKPGVSCPVCRKFSAENEIRSNHFVNDLLGFQKEKMTSQVKSCAQCPRSWVDPEDAKWKCLDCRINLCDKCKESHLAVPVLKGHHILPLNEDTEMVVDQLVFCTRHNDTPVVFFCCDCKELLCYKCQVTSHRSHNVVTVETALDKLVPETEENAKFIDKELEDIEKGISEIENKIGETKTAYLTCRNEFEEKAKQRIQDIKEELTKINTELLQKEQVEVRKLKDAKIQLQNQKKEKENLQKVVRTSIERARHATLLTELIEGGICEGLRRLKCDEKEQPKIDVQLPKVVDNRGQWKRLQQNGLLGKVVYNIMSLVLVMDACLTPQLSGLSRYHAGNFKEIFTKPLKKRNEIMLKGNATRIFVIKNRIWVPSYDFNVIKIYSKYGDLQKVINLKTPVSLTLTQTGDILAACQSNGLYRVSEKDNNNSIKIADGSYSDVATWNDQVFAWEYNKMQIVEFHKNGKWQKYRHIDLNYTRSGSECDTLLPYVSHHGNALQFFIATTQNHVIYHINEQGQLLQQYTDAQGVNFCYPFLCGTDSQGDLLVADNHNYKYKLLDINTGQWSEVFTGQNIVYDAIMDGDQAVWLIKYNGMNCTILKYEC